MLVDRRNNSVDCVADIFKKLSWLYLAGTGLGHPGSHTSERLRAGSAVSWVSLYRHVWQPRKDPNGELCY